MKLFIITGAGRGLGQSLFEELKNNGHKVIDLSRSSKSYPIDLNQLSSIPKVLKNVFERENLTDYREISLINNAGMIQPIGQSGQLLSLEIEKNINVNLSAPIILTNEFLKILNDFAGKIKITFISSGVAKRPKAYWGPYSAAKTGLEAYAYALQNEMNQKVEVFCCDPGLIDTQMQSEIRSTSREDFPENERFKEFKASGLLVDPIIVAQNILKEIGEF